MDSVLAQTYQNWECIVVDDGSTDNTAEVMKRYMAKDSRFQYHNRPNNMLPGGNAARNYGFVLSNGEYIQWFDDDDFMIFNCLEIKVSSISADKWITITNGVKKQVDGNTSKLQFCKSVNLFNDYIMGNSNILTPSVMFRSSFLKNKELFHTSLQRSQEAEFFSRIFYDLKPDKIAIEDSITFRYLVTTDSKSLKDKIYNSTFKRSHFLVHYNNLVRSIKLGENQMANLLYKKISKLLEASIYNHDAADYNFYISHLRNLVKPNRFFYLKFNYVLFKLLNRRSYRILKLQRAVPVNIKWFREVIDEQYFYITDIK